MKVHIDVVKLLIEKGADLNAKDQDYGDTPLIWAINENCTNAAILLIDSGANLNATNKFGQTALGKAKGKKLDEIVKALTAKGVQN